jgi:cytidyltransferase-like protein
MPKVLVYGPFDEVTARSVRFLEEAARLGDVHVLLWSDLAMHSLTGSPPRFTEAERLYVVQAIRWVSSVSVTAGSIDAERPDQPSGRFAAWAVAEGEDTPRRREAARLLGATLNPLPEEGLHVFPPGSSPADRAATSRPRVVVTGCFDWVHSGHVRFFEESSAHGDLYVVVGSDRNLLLLKGPGHPLFPQGQRRYHVAAMKSVFQASIATGSGWMDAAPEIETIRPDIYVVNDDGDRPEKAEFCRERGIRYLVLKRTPRPGLPARTSTALRGF